MKPLLITIAAKIVDCDVGSSVKITDVDSVHDGRRYRPVRSFGRNPVHAEFSVLRFGSHQIQGSETDASSSEVHLEAALCNKF